MLVAAASLALAGSATGTPVLTLADPEITESSGLVDLGAVMVTTNDSGGGPLVQVVDSRTGQTVGRTTYARSVEDVEALAPAGDKHVWVGDIGDNRAARRSIQVYKVPVGRGDRTVDAPSYDLTYPDGPQDAESLLRGPDGRLRIITKGLLGGQVFVAPARLDPDRPNMLVPGPSVGLFATDAAMFPDGRHALVRGYDAAEIVTFPAFEPVARFGLPFQRQGEGVSVGPNGRIRISTEGAGSRVLQLTLPAEARAVLRPVAPAAPARPVRDAGDDSADRAGGISLLWAGVVAGAAAVIGWVVTRRARSGSRRRRNR